MIDMITYRILHIPTGNFILKQIKDQDCIGSAYFERKFLFKIFAIIALWRMKENTFCRVADFDICRTETVKLEQFNKSEFCVVAVNSSWVIWRNE